ncbi:PREDICTED: uncharacterized protein LOC109344555 [Lupinus angustifolius]|uniref:uncharacterized protein LOC109344555 n=1 Tax=Lupinus angustifolius TaxID=3871 RepID=UPI00092ED3F0|nr:PREDICTED: uncharacterized protein LOC109344555 [Lupinus angustifolius]
MTNGNGFVMTLPILDTKNYDRWRTIFGFQEVLEIVQNGYQEVRENENEAQRTSYRESKKKDCKALFLIHQFFDEANFERIVGAKTTKEASDSLEKSYEGAAKMKKVKLQTMRRKYELLQMKENETIAYYFIKILTLINQMKSCGEEVKRQSIMEKILKTLTHKYDHIIVAIEESKNLEAYNIEELQSSLEAHEQRLKERGIEKNDDHALQAQSFKKPSGQWNKNNKKEKWNKFEQGSPSQRPNSTNNFEHDQRKDSRNRRIFDKKRVQCYNFREYGHYAA